MKKIFEYDEDGLRRFLARASARDAFTASCAEWLFQLTADYVDAVSINRLGGALDAVWSAIGGERTNLRLAIDTATSVTPDEDDPLWRWDWALFQHASLGVAYAAETVADSNAEAAFYAASQIYSVADYVAQGPGTENEVFDTTLELRLLQDPVTQEALGYLIGLQDRLGTATADQLADLEVLRADARARGRIWLEMVRQQGN